MHLRFHLWCRVLPQGRHTSFKSSIGNLKTVEEVNPHFYSYHGMFFWDAQGKEELFCAEEGIKFMSYSPSINRYMVPYLEPVLPRRRSQLRPSKIAITRDFMHVPKTWICQRQTSEVFATASKGLADKSVRPLRQVTSRTLFSHVFYRLIDSGG